MASVAPFSRRSWGSQSMRVTAKELSIISARGKNNAIAERFSKYQMAAEEGNADKRKMVSESLPPTLRTGNLSVLKKRWEQQQQQQSSHRAQPQVAPQTHAPGPKPQIQTRPTTSHFQDQDIQTEAHSQTADEEQAAMEKKPRRDPERQEGAAAEVPASEKPNVPLNSLKMMFEKGENLTDKVSREQTRSGGNSGNPANMDQLLGDGSLADSAPLRDRMALYKAAVSKQEPLPTSVSSDQLESYCGKQKENVPPCTLDMGSDSESNSWKASTPDSHSNAGSGSSTGDSSQPKTTKQNFLLPVRESCVSCLKTVYPLEKLVANQQVYHSSCFRCSHCNTKLSLGSYASLHSNVYCKPHFCQLFKAKGNYDEGFGLRPHKELWESKDESETPVPSMTRTKPNIQTPPPASDLSSPSVEESPLAKVNVLAATMETLGQGSAEKADRPTETRKLKISWPPQTQVDGGAGHTGATPELGATGRPVRAKWPPGEGAPSSSTNQNPEASDLSSLRRSGSLKERSRPFTLAVQPRATPEAQRQSPPLPSESQAMDDRKASPEPTSMELQLGGQSPVSRTSTDDSCVDVHSSSGEEDEMKNGDSPDPRLTQEEELAKGPQGPDPSLTREKELTNAPQGPDPTLSRAEELTNGPRGGEERMEEEEMEGVDGDITEDELPTLKGQDSPTEPPAMSSPDGEAEARPSSQDVGFWDSEEAYDREAEQQQQEQEALSVEEMIKRNRHYEDEQEEEDV